MFFLGKKPNHISAVEFMLLEDKLMEMISRYRKGEETAETESKGFLLKELAVCNTRLFFKDLDDVHAIKFRETIMTKGSSEDFAILRLKDLHIKISSCFPKEYVSSKIDEFSTACDATNMTKSGTAKRVLKTYPWAWVIFFIQQHIRDYGSVT